MGMDADYALSFLHHKGLTLLLNLLKNGHPTAKDATLASFLNLICHYSVISAIVNEDHLVVDMDVFTTLIACSMQSGELGEKKIIKESMSVLSFFIQTLPNGFQLFRQAVLTFSKENDPYQSLANNVIHSQLYQESLRLLQLIIRNSIIINTSEPIDRLTKYGLVENLKSLRIIEDPLINLSEADKILIDEILLPLGDTCSRVWWYIDAVKRQPTKKIIEKVINGMGSNMSKRDIFKIADERVEDQLEDHLIEIRENMEKEFSRMSSTLTSLGSPSSTNSPTNIGSPDSISRQAIESVPVTPTSPLQTTTESGAVPIGHSISRQASESVPVTTTSTLQTTIESGAVPIGHLCIHEECKFTPCIFFNILTDYLKTLFTALKLGGGAPIQLEAIDQCIDLPGKARKRSNVLPISFKRSTKREKKEEQISFLIDVVSESTSQTLALRYYSALSNLSASDVQKLAECALWKIMEGLQETQSKSSCNAILKSITTKPQEYIHVFLSYVQGKPLPTSIHVCHPKDGNINVNNFFKRNQSQKKTGQKDISRLSIPSSLKSNITSEKKSHVVETKESSSNPVPNLPTKKSDALKRIREIELQLQQTIASISQLNTTVGELNLAVGKLEVEVKEMRSAFK